MAEYERSGAEPSAADARFMADYASSVPEKTTLSWSTPELDLAPQNHSDGEAVNAATVTTCWTAKGTGRGHNAFGATLWTEWVVLGWCGTPRIVTRTATLKEQGYSTNGSLGWTSAGNVGHGAGRIGYTVSRAWTQYSFTLRIANVPAQNVTPCTRVNGTRSGSFSVTAACGLY